MAKGVANIGLTIDIVLMKQEMSSGRGWLRGVCVIWNSYRPPPIATLQVPLLQWCVASRSSFCNCKKLSPLTSTPCMNTTLPLFLKGVFCGDKDLDAAQFLLLYFSFTSNLFRSCFSKQNNHVLPLHSIHFMGCWYIYYVSNWLYLGSCRVTALFIFKTLV